MKNLSEFLFLLAIFFAFGAIFFDLITNLDVDYAPVVAMFGLAGVAWSFS